MGGMTKKTDIKMLPMSEANLVNLYGLMEDRIQSENKLIHSRKIILLDTRIAKRYYPLLDGLKISDKKLIPTVIYEDRGGLGAGPTDFIDIFNHFYNPASALYFPNLLVSYLVNIAASSTIDALKMIYKNLKEKQPNKRLPLVYFSPNKRDVFEFPSHATIFEFEEGIKKIPDTSKLTPDSSYFYLNTKELTWIKEDLS